MAGRTKARREAIENGWVHYHGKPCSKHGTTERYTSTGSCVQCIRESEKRTPEQRLSQGRKQYASNPEARRLSSARYRQRNREKVSQQSREWRSKNLDAIREYQRRYIQEHAKNRALLQRMRKARQRRAGAELTGEQLAEMRAIYADAASKGMHVDHIVPLAGCRVCGAFGLHAPQNLQLLTPRENLMKQNRCNECWRASSEAA